MPGLIEVALVLHARVRFVVPGMSHRKGQAQSSMCLRGDAVPDGPGAPVLDTASRVVALKLCENDIAGHPWQPLQANKGGAAHTVFNGGIVQLQAGAKA